MSMILPTSQRFRLPPWTLDPLNHLFVASIAVIIGSASVIQHGLSANARTEIDFARPVLPDRNPLFTGNIWAYQTQVKSFIPEASPHAIPPQVPTDTHLGIELSPPSFPSRRADAGLPPPLDHKPSRRRRKRR